MKLLLLLLLSCFLSLCLGELQIIKNFEPEQCAKKSAIGDRLFMHYVGSIDESSETGDKGSEFDSSRKRGTPFDFVLGQGNVIRGWDEGLVDMCIGEKRTLIIPPELGYGSRGAGGAIPGGATLRFEVELVSAGPGGPPGGPGGPRGGPGGPRGHMDGPPNIFKEMDANEDRKLTRTEFNAWFSGQRGHGITEVPEGLFEREDKNGDGTITFEEFSGPKGEPMPGQMQDL